MCIEAVEQSESCCVPKMKEKRTYELLENWDRERVIIFCDEERKEKIF